MTPLAPSLDQFYSPPNEVNPEQLRGEFADLMAVLVGRLPKRRTLLPARVNAMTRWYGIAPSDRETRLLREELASWLGAPISAVTKASVLHGDDLDLAAKRLVPDATVLRVDVTPGWQDAARRNVASLTDVWALAPDRGVDQPRPVGRVLRQFYESVLASDRSSAEAALDEIRTRALLSATNVRFLRVELIAALGSSAELRDEPSLRDISLLARPPAVTEHLAAAAHDLYIDPVLAQPEASHQWLTAAKQLEDAWPGLVTHGHHVTNLATARCFALGQLLVVEPHASLLLQVQDRFTGDSVIHAIVQELQLGEPPPTSAATAIGLYYEGRYVEALAAVASEGATRASAAVALASAVNVADIPAAQRALALIDALPDDERQALLASNVEHAFYSQLLAKTSDAAVPTGWLSWLAGEWVDRPDVLAEWAREWPRTAENLERDADAIAGALLDALNDTRRGRVRNGVPVFVDWLVRDGLPPSGLSLAVITFDILLSSEPGRTERNAALALLDEVLTAGCSREEYRSLLAAVTDQLGTLGPRDAGWLAQCLELFLISSCADTAGRDALIARAGGIAQAWSDRVDATDGLLLNCVLGAAGITLSTTRIPLDSPAGDVSMERSVSRVGIYSLLEPAANLAAKWIRERWPSTEVTVSSDHVNTSALATLARSAGLLLVHTSHATHAATQAVIAAAPDPTRIVFVHGRGATSLFRAVLDWSKKA